jgi:protein-S-isoprenylcysteine O-methyltransferase Ste14
MREIESRFNYFISHNRIFLSRLAGVFIVGVWSISESYWNQNSQAFASSLFLFGVILVGIAGMGRMWCSLYIAGYKNRKLVTVGPYSIMRNPLYFFSMIGLLGVGFLTETITFPLVLITLFAIYYPAIIEREERDLESIFGEEYRKYREKVPTFFPSPSLYKDPSEYVVKPSIFRNHLLSAIWFVWSIGVVYFLQTLRDSFLEYKILLF